MLMRLAGLACVAAALLPQLPAPAAATSQAPPPATRLTVRAVTVPLTADAAGAPGALVPVVLRLEHATPSTTADLELTTRGVHAACTGAPRYDAAQHTLSRRCSVRIPAGSSHVRLRGYARILTDRA